MLAGLAVAACALLCDGAPAQSVEINAKHWFNPITIRVPEERTYVLLFFSTVQGKDETKRCLARLGKLRSKPDTVVIGLSAESSKRVGSFVKKHGIRFPVGAKSKAYKRFRIRKFPAIVVLDFAERATGMQPSVWSLDQLDEYVGPYADEAEIIPGAFDETSSVEQLQDHARNDPDDMQRGRALELLRNNMDAQTFMRLCDDLLRSTDDSVMRGNIAYQRQLANPATVAKEPYLSPSVQAARLRRENPDAPQWERLRDYETRVSELSQDQLVADFFEYQTNAMDPENLLIRREVASRFNAISDDGSPAEKEEARVQLMQMLPGEPDAAVRLWLVGALWATTAPGDFEVADFLTEQLKTEPNVRSVRPMMETVVRCMRTGEGPCD